MFSWSCEQSFSAFIYNILTPDSENIWKSPQESPTTCVRYIPKEKQIIAAELLIPMTFFLCCPI